VRNWVADATAKIKIKADFHDAEDDNLASGLSNVICKDGQTAITADIPFNGKKITNLANPVNPQDAATKNYAETLRSFNSGMTLTGPSTGTSPNFVSTAFMGFTEADLSIVARKADNSVTPPTVDRIMLNSTANGSGPDIGALATQTAQARNRIVNGAMQISQENGNTAGTVSAYYAADQWSYAVVTTGVAGMQRVQVTTPNGSRDRIRFTVNTADTSIAATEQLQAFQALEGSRMADFLYGTASARQSVLRFGFNGPAGTYALSLRNDAGSRSYIQNFTIAAGQANIDTTQTFVIPGDTTGTWPIDTSCWGRLCIVLMSGSTYIAGTSGWSAGVFLGAAGLSNFMATQGQIAELFDVGLYLDPANSGIPPRWEMPDEAQELTSCRRYWEYGSSAWNGYATTGVSFSTPINFVVKRITPAMSGVSTTTISFPATSSYAAIPMWGLAYRAANATAAGAFSDNWVANARM